jgi:hypothetical protein
MNNDHRCSAKPDPADNAPEPEPRPQRDLPFAFRKGHTRRRAFVTEMPDDVLLSGFHARDPMLAPRFVRRFQTSVYGVAISIVSDVVLAQDIAESAFEQAWRRADTYDPRRGSVRTWLLRMRVRHSRRKRPPRRPSRSPATAPASTPAPRPAYSDA